MRAETGVNNYTSMADAGMASQKRFYQGDGVDKGFCWKCLVNGHSCETDNHVEGKFLCVFCEDEKECPRVAMERRRAAQPLPSWKGGGRKKRVEDAQGEPPAADHPSSGSCRGPRERLRAGRAIKDVKEVKSGRDAKIQNGEDVMAKLCACGCGEETKSNRSPYVKGHNPATKNVAKRADGGAGSASSAKPRKAARVLSAGDDEAVETVKVAVTGEFFDAWFAGKTLREKAAIFEAAGA